MFGKRRNEKIKAVFKLQFQATLVAKPGSRLIVSLVPADVGQPTAKLGKSTVQEDGNCTWENPVFESVKLTRDTKSGKIQDKFYYFVVATGSSKKGFLGEAPINFADFVEDVAPVLISLPIDGSNSGAMLHVTIQNVQGASDSRENLPCRYNEEYEGAAVDTSHDKTLRSQLSSSTLGRVSDCDSKEDSLPDMALQSDNERAKKFSDYINSSPSPSRNSFPSSKKPCVANGNDSGEESPRLEWSSPEYSVESARNCNDRILTRSEQETTLDTPLEQLKKEIASLERQAEVTDIELQSLRRQIMKESKKGQDLTTQVHTLKEERDALKSECDKLKSMQRKSKDWDEKTSVEGEIEGDESGDQLTEMREELTHLKNINKMLRRNLGKTQDSNSELVLVVKDLERRLEKKDTEVARLSDDIRELQNSGECHAVGVYKVGRDEKTAVPEELLPSNTREVNLLKVRIEELEVEVENQDKAKKKIEMETKQTLKDFEILKQQKSDAFLMFEQAKTQVAEKEKQCTCYIHVIEELESEIERLEKVIENQAGEFLESSDIAQRHETEIKDLQKKLDDQTMEYEMKLREIENAKDGQEHRALQVEEELRKTKMNNAAAAERVQEEFNKLSAELAIKFDENEKLTIEAQNKVGELQTQVKVLEGELQKAKEEVNLMETKHEGEVKDLAEQLEQKDEQLEQLMLKLQEECELLKRAKEKQEQKQNALSKENEALRVEMERLTEENYHLSKQSESFKVQLELITASMSETKRLLDVTNKEKDDLERKYCLSRNEAQQSQEKLDDLKSNLERKEAMVGSFQSELHRLNAQHEELKNHLTGEKSQNESLKKLVSQQKEELNKKDQAIALLEETNKHDTSKDPTGSKDKSKQLKAVRGGRMPTENGNKVEEGRHAGKKQLPSEVGTSVSSLQNGINKAPGKSPRERCSEKNHKVSDVRSYNEGELARVLAEVAELKEKNKLMDGELKEMQDKYSEVSLRFAEVEGERQQLVMTVRNLKNAQRK